MSNQQWSCQIISVQDNPVPNGTRYLEVRFSKAETSFTRTYKLVPGNFPDANSVTTFLGDRVAELDSMDIAAAVLQNISGQELVAGQGLPPQPLKPGEVTNFQARVTLIAAGLFTTVDQTIKGMGVDSEAYQAWEYNNTFSIDSPLLRSIATALNLSDDELRSLFSSAAQVSV